MCVCGGEGRVKGLGGRGAWTKRKVSEASIGRKTDGAKFC